MSIVLHNVSFAYPKAEPVLQGLNFSIDDGESVLLVGQNGAGKSTLLKLLNGILKPTEGTVTVNALGTTHAPTSSLAAHIAVTFQNPADQIFASTVRGEVQFGPRILGRPDFERLTDDALDLFGLVDVESRHPYDLPLAQRKLLTLASAVATNAPILAFDEPSASLGQTERTVVRRALENLRRRRKTLLVVSHDLDLFIPEATKLIVLAAGHILHIGTPSDLLENRRIAAKARIRLSVPHRLQMLISASHGQR